MRRIVISILLLGLSLAASAQLLQPVYSAPSPQAGALGEYGEVPVSHFTGTPEVSVPLFEVEAGDYKYPVGLSYHLSSVKPHAQPGPAGMGWMLTDACISRTVRGVYDEKMDLDGVAHGYYGHCSKMQGITNQAFDNYTRDNLTAWDNQTQWFELSADEFSFSMNGHGGLFYLNPAGTWTVVSDEAIAVEFDPATDFMGYQELTGRIPKLFHWAGRAENARWIKRFTLVTPDGVRYEFGGVNAIDFSVSYYGRNAADLVATAWHLTRITTPEGYVISFDYSDDQLLCDLHYATGRTTSYDLSGTPTSSRDIHGRAGLSGFLIYPAALTRIAGPADTLEVTYRQNEIYNASFRNRYPDALYWEDPDIRAENLFHFSSSDPRTEFFELIPVTDSGNMKQNQRNIADCFRQDLIHRITRTPRYGGKGLSWYFNLEDSVHPRLRDLYCREGVPELEYDWIEGGGVMYPRLRIPADTSSTSLPRWHFSYHAGALLPDNLIFPATDAWGYWKGGESCLSSPFFPRTDAPAAIRFSQTGTLRDLYYPTGGHVSFEYERNEYGKLARADHTGVMVESGTCGGLRVRSVTLRDRAGKVHGVTRYHYVDGIDSGGSSGIAAGLPPATVYYYLNGGDAGMTVESSEGFPAVATNRNTPPVGYSSVTEERLDSAGTTLGFIRYRYSNFVADPSGAVHLDEPFFHSYNCGTGLVGVPYTSNSAERGRLLTKEWFDTQKNLVRKETTGYARVCNDSLVVADQRVVFLTLDPYYPEVAHMGWLTRTRTYSYLPVGTEVTEYTASGALTQETSTTYNSFKLPSLTTVSRSDGVPAQTAYTYSADSPQYGWMAARHILNAPVSVQTSVGGAVRTESSTYTQATNALGNPAPFIAQATVTHAGSSDPKTVYEVHAVDAWANPVSISVDGLDSRLTWLYDGQRLQRVEDNVQPAPLRGSGAPHQPGLRSGIDFGVVPLPFDGTLRKEWFYDPDLRPLLAAGPNDLASIYAYDALGRLVGTREADASDGWGEQRLLETTDYHYPPPLIDYSGEYYVPEGDPGSGAGAGSGSPSLPHDPNEPQAYDPIRSVDLVTGYNTYLNLDYISDAYHEIHPTNRGQLIVSDTTLIRFKVANFSYYHDSGDPLTKDATRLDLRLYQQFISADSLITHLPLCVDSQTLVPFTWPDPTDTTGVEISLAPGQYEVVFGGITCVDIDETGPVFPDGRGGGGSRNLEDPEGPDPIGPSLEELAHYPAFRLVMECPDGGGIEEEEIPVIEEPEPLQWGYVRHGVSRDGTALNMSRTVDWHDDFGRKEVSVAVGAGPAGEDLVSLVERDGWGREEKNWLPAVSQTTLPVVRPGTTRVKQLAGATYGAAEKPYSLTEYEPSVLSRVTGLYGPGAAWQNAGKKVATAYLTNQASGAQLSCRLFSCTGSGTAWTVTSSGNYAAGTLHVTQTTDEDGRIVLEFKDFDGQTVLSRAKLATGQYLDTYYVYDGFGNLRAVLPPLASAAFSAGAVPQDALADYAYLYTYDDRDRCIVKKLPGAQPVYYVYDEADRVVLTQDGNARAKGEAQFTLYDVFGRPALSGTCRNAVCPGDRLLTYTKASYTGGAGTMKGYSVEGITLVAPVILTVSWYDTHSFVEDVLGVTLPASDTTLVYGAPAPISSGLQTGTWTAMLGVRETADPDGTWSVIRYDRRNRVAKTVSSSHAGDRTVEDVDYTFRGAPKRRHIVHYPAQGNPITEDYGASYDHEERLLAEHHSLNGADSLTLVTNSYDPLGRLSASGRAGASTLTTQYGYNIRSWTTGISTPFFSETLYYNAPRPGSNAAAQWGGNISSMAWDSSKAYDYTYDGLSRLTGAAHNGGTAHSRQYAYDAHGNITGLTAGGNVQSFTYTGNRLSTSQYDANGNLTADPGTGVVSARYNVLNLPEEIIKANGDTLRYAYSAAGEKLREKVIPPAPSASALRTDYVGNLIYRNGLLGRILVDGGSVVAKDSSLTPVYEFAFADHLGSVRALARLGDTLVRKTDYGPYGEILTEAWAQTSALPAGPAIAGTIQTLLPNPYRFGGKERLDAAGLELYDFGARHFAPALPRWTTMDLLAEQFFGVSPYVYCAGNPVNRIDSDGMIDKEWLKKGGVTLGTGLALTIGGALAITSGAAATVGAYSLSTGIPSIGLGLGMVIIGLSTDPTPEGRKQLESMPTGLADAIGKSFDETVGTEKHEFEITLNFIDGIIGLGTLSKPKSAIDLYTNSLTVIQAGYVAKEMGEMVMDMVSTQEKCFTPQVFNQNEEYDWKLDLDDYYLWKP